MRRINRKTTMAFSAHLLKGHMIIGKPPGLDAVRSASYTAPADIALNARNE